MLESEIFPNPRRFLKAVCNLLVNESNMPGKLSHPLKHGKPKHWQCIRATEDVGFGSAVPAAASLQRSSQSSRGDAVYSDRLCISGGDRGVFSHFSSNRLLFCPVEADKLPKENTIQHLYKWLL